MRFNSVARGASSSYSPGLNRLRFLANSRRYSNSLADPVAIEQNRASSASPFRPHPSDRLAATEALARRSWLVNP